MEEHYTKLLNSMLVDMGHAPSIYQPTTFWQHAANAITDEVSLNELNEFKSNPYTRAYFVPSYAQNFDPECHQQINEAIQKNSVLMPKLETRLQRLFSGELQAFEDYRTFLASSTDTHPYTNKASESPVGAPQEQFKFDGRYYSRAFLNYLLGINFLKKHCNTENIYRVLEIGGGYGALGEILLSDTRNKCFYMNVDIPPTALFASYYLQSIFGQDNIADYNSHQTQESISIDDWQQHYAALVLCPWQLPKLTGKIDLFVNFISFQEMEPTVVRHYLEHIQRLSPNYILLRNLREGKQLAKSSSEIGVKEPILGEDYDQFITDYTLTATNTVPFGFKTDDGFHSELRLYRRTR